MTKVLVGQLFAQFFDNVGELLDGGLIYSYEGGTTTPTATWTSSVGHDLVGTHTNPIECDSAGRVQGGIWVTSGTAYKFILKTAAGATLDTEDNVVIGEVAASSAVGTEYEVAFTYCGTPGAQAFMGGLTFIRSVTFPVDFDGAAGHVGTNGLASYTFKVQKNGADVGTIAVDTSGAFTFATSGGTTVACVSGDTLRLVSPDAIATIADFTITLVGALV